MILKTATYRKHLLETVFRRRRYAQHAEVSDKSGCDRVSTAARGRTRRTDCHVLQTAEVQWNTTKTDATHSVIQCCN